MIEKVDLKYKVGKPKSENMDLRLVNSELQINEMQCYM